MRRQFVLLIEQLERRDTPASVGLAPGFPAPLAASGPFDGTVTLFPSLFPSGQFNASALAVGTVTPFPGFAGVVRTAFADVNGDSVQDLVAVTGPGTPIRLAVLSGTNFLSYLVPPLDPFGGGFTGGGFVAAGDIDNNLDNLAEIVVTPDQGGGPRVAVFTRAPLTILRRADFFGIDDPGFRGGARPAVGDFDADGFADLAVAAGPGGGPRVAVYDGQTFFAATPPRKLVGNDFFAFPNAGSDALRNGVYLAAGDVNADGFDDLVVGAGAGGGPRVIALNGRSLTGGNVGLAQANLLADFFFGDPNSRGGVRVAAKDTGTGTRSEIVVGSGENLPSRVRVYTGLANTGGEPRPFEDIDPYGRVLADGVYVG